MSCVITFIFSKLKTEISEKRLPTVFCCFSPIFDDQDRLRTLINMLAADLSNSIAQSGHSYAMSLASSSLTPAAKLGEMFGGLSQVTVFFMLKCDD